MMDIVMVRMNRVVAKGMTPALLLGLVGLVGCAGPSFGEATKIAAIQRQNKDAVVSLSGKVTTRAPLLGQQAYEIQDESGTIWVVTKDAAPAAGTEVQVRGKVRYQSILLAGKEQGSVYIEQQ
jgi:uncharacterized protein YdeI (BOF family)